METPKTVPVDPVKPAVPPVGEVKPMVETKPLAEVAKPVATPPTAEPKH